MDDIRSLESPPTPTIDEGTVKKGEVFLDEVKKQLWLSGPLIASGLLQTVLQTISVMFVSHLGGLALSGASMATCFVTVTSYSVMFGMGSALDTFCGQNYGAKQYNKVGIHMQTAMLVLMLVGVLVSIILVYTEQILIAFRQDPQISKEAGVYAVWLIPSVFAHGLLQCLSRFLQAQNIVFPMMSCSGIITLLHALLCWILVIKSGFGSKGAALAVSVSYWSNVVLLALYVKLSTRCQKTWTGFSKEALHDILSFVKLAVSSAVMICMEFWAFELLLLLSGLLPNPKLETSVLAISLNANALLYMIPFGLSNAVSTRVSNELGAARTESARLAVHVSVLLSIIQGSILCLIVALMRGVLANAYSNEKEVVKHLKIMLPMVGASKFADGVQTVLSGVVRGCGRQKIGAYVNLASYYIVGIPCGVILAFVIHMQVMGLWIGITCGVVVQMLLYIAITLCTNWEKEAGKARDRVCSSVPEDMAK